MKSVIIAAGVALLFAPVDDQIFSSASAESSLVESATYYKDVEPLLADRCVMCHHDNGSAPFALETYADVKRRAALIAGVTKKRYMPPWKADPADGHFVGQHPLTEPEISLIQRWVADGAPQGDPADRARSIRQTQDARPSKDEWQLGRPDLVVTLADA